MREPAYPEIIVTTLVAADTQYSADLPKNCVYFTIRSRTADTAFRIAFEADKVTAPTDPYFTIPANSAYNSPEHFSPAATKADRTALLQTTGKLKIYLATDSAGQIIEILAWATPPKGPA